MSKIMYCSSCGTEVKAALRYCKRCGNNLRGQADPEDESVESPAAVGIDIFWTTVIGLGLILGGMIALKKLDFREAFIVGYMIVSSVAFLGLFSLDVWRFIRVTRHPQGTSGDNQEQKADTKELNGASVRVLPEPVPSVVENTTRSLEPSRNKELPH